MPIKQLKDKWGDHFAFYIHQWFQASIAFNFPGLSLPIFFSEQMIWLTTSELGPPGPLLLTVSSLTGEILTVSICGEIAISPNEQQKQTFRGFI